MGRKRKKHNQGLPKGVYRNHKKFISKVWDGNKLQVCGTYSTPEEAEYRMLIATQGHHWKGMQEGPYFGFTYIITNRKTGKRYIGKKQFYLWDGPVGGYKCTDMTSEWWDEKAWKESDWKTYTGSQKDLNNEIAMGHVWDFTYEVHEMCRTKLDLHISEVNFMIEHDVLEATDENGEYLWYNKNIASLEFRPPFKKDQVRNLKKRSEEEMRLYYLKPSLDSEGNVIPFGHEPFAPRGFEDVT